MPIRFLSLALFLLVCLRLSAQSIPLIPAPAKIRLDTGNYIKLSRLEFAMEIREKAQKGYRYFDWVTGGRYRQKSKTPNMGIYLFDGENMPEGAFRMECSRKDDQFGRITIKAASESGFRHAFQVLYQLMELYDHQRLPCFEIEDAPAFSWRGLHLDVSRHFFEVAEIKKLLRVMSFYRLNVFHWHLTDDQGWRIEIKRYPELCRAGSLRKETLIGHASASPEVFDKTEYAGYYTQREIKLLVAFADSLGITIVPEIEMPGHSQAAVTAYPWLGPTGKKPGVWTKWGVSPWILAPKDSVFTFLEHVLTEVMELFPSKYIHIGGDEATKEQWIASPEVQKKIRSLGLKDEHELQSWFIRRIEQFVNGKGRQIIGWDEILEGGLAPNAAVMSWRGEAGGLEAAAMKHPVVMSPGKPLYFDHYQSDPGLEPLAIGGLNSLEAVYSYHPLPAGIPQESKSYIMGAQANLWTEYIQNASHLEYMAFPRALALAEACWSGKERKNYSDFLNRLESHRQLLKKFGVNFREWRK